MEEKKSYPGGKAGNGVYQTIINLMPPHETYIETHLGGGAILRKKRPATRNIGIDIDARVIDAWAGKKALNMKLHNGDAVTFLRNYNFIGRELVYCDPPYVQETRKTGKIYRFEYTEKQHIQLLECITKLECMVIISGYYSELYATELSDWNCKIFQAQTRGGSPATEYAWFNFAEPVFLHDPQYIGRDYRERERIKKKANRWVNRFQTLPLLEKQAIMAALKKGGVF